MSRYVVHQKDSTQDAIVAALEAAGWQVFTHLPCDLLCFKAGIWRTLEAKPPKNKRNEPRLRSVQSRQAAFLAQTNTPVAVTPEQALRALGSVL